MYQMSFFEVESSSTRLLNAPFELAEPLLAGHEVGAARLEHLPAFALDALGDAGGGTRSCRRAARRLREAIAAAGQNGGLGACEHLAPGLRLQEEVELAIAFPPEAAEGGEERAVDHGALLRVDFSDKPFRKRAVQPSEKAPDRTDSWPAETPSSAGRRRRPPQAAPLRRDIPARLSG